MKAVIFLLPLLLIIVSANGRIANEKLEEVDNVINQETKLPLPVPVKPILIDLLVYNTTEAPPNHTEVPNNTTRVLKEAPGCDNSTEFTDNNLDAQINESCITEARVDNGTALLLTKLYLNYDLYLDARRACKVNPEVFLGFESYSGFFTVNETYNSNVFFWYFPVEKKPVNETPWIIWLQGGPGASSLTGLFDEIGPFHVDRDGNLVRNPYSWLQNHSLLFIDNPVGTGYSFTEHEDGYVTDMYTYSHHLYDTVRQFIQIFPELKNAPLYVAGESYAGKYVPALATQIHRNRQDGGPDFNLQGILVGNGYVEPAMIAQMIMPYYYFGLLEPEQMEIVKPLVTAFQHDVAVNNSTAAKTRWTHLVTVLIFLTHQKHLYNFLRDDLVIGRFARYLDTTAVKRALHVGDTKYHTVNMTVNERLKGEFLSSAKPLYEELLEAGYRVLLYCGQLDQMLPCALTSENYRTWQWSDAKMFVDAPRFPFLYKNRLAGYHKSGGRLTEVIIRGAGHMAPQDAPAPVRDLVTRWTHLQPLSTHMPLISSAFLQDYIRNHSSVHYL